MKSQTRNIPLYAAVLLASLASPLNASSQTREPAKQPGIVVGNPIVAIESVLTEETKAMNDPIGIPAMTPAGAGAFGAVTERTQAVAEWKARHADDHRDVRFAVTFYPVAQGTYAVGMVVYGVEQVDLTYTPVGAPDYLTRDKQADMELARQRGAVYENGMAVHSRMLARVQYTLVRNGNAWTVARRLDVELDQVPLDARLRALLYPTGARILLYNFVGAAAYEDQWWNKRNPAYSSYSADCANFWSQAASDSSGGKLPRSNTWKPGTTAFINADALYQYCRSNFRLGENGGQSWSAANDYQRQRAIRGDLLGYDWNGGPDRVEHVAMPTAYEGNGSCLVDAHTLDVYRWPWDLKVKNARLYYVMLIK